MPSKTSKSRKTATTKTKKFGTPKHTNWTGPSPKFTSPFGPAFTSAINRGTPCFVAVNNIANRTGKTPKAVFTSLCKAGLCFGQKVGGQWIYWPVNTPKKSSSTNIKTCQHNMWQWFIDWCITSGFTTPAKLHNNCNSQVQFMNFCKKFWGKQFSSSTGSKTVKGHGKGYSKSYSPKSYKFPTVGTRTYGKRKVA